MINTYNFCVLLTREKKDDKYFTLQQDNYGIVAKDTGDFKIGDKVYFNKIEGEVGDYIVVKEDNIYAYERD
jgi:hypothetical protein